MIKTFSFIVLNNGTALTFFYAASNEICRSLAHIPALSILSDGLKKTTSLDTKTETVCLLGCIAALDCKSKDAVLNTGAFNLLLKSLQAISQRVSSFGQNEQQRKFIFHSVCFLLHLKDLGGKWDSIFVECLGILFDCKHEDVMMKLVEACSLFMNRDTTRKGQSLKDALIEIGVDEYCVKLLRIQFEKSNDAALDTIVECLSLIFISDKWSQGVHEGVISIISMFLHSESNQRHAFPLIQSLSHFPVWSKVFAERNIIKVIVQTLHQQENLCPLGAMAIKALSLAICYRSVRDEFDLIFIEVVTKILPERIKTQTICDGESLYYLDAILVILKRDAGHCTILVKCGFIDLLKYLNGRRPAPKDYCRKVDLTKKLIIREIFEILYAFLYESQQEDKTL